MTEDYAIQQQRPSATPYALGGALVGGGAGAGAVYGIKKVGNWVSEPGKYNSFQDIVNEAEDEFTKKMETVEDKDLVTKAKEARQRIADGEAQWEKDKAEYLEKNKNGVTEGTSEALTKAENDLKTAESALESKRQALIDEEVKKINETNGSKKELHPSAKKALENYKADLKAETEALERNVKIMNEELRSTHMQDFAEACINLEGIEPEAEKARTRIELEYGGELKKLKETEEFKNLNENQKQVKLNEVNEAKNRELKELNDRVKTKKTKGRGDLEALESLLKEDYAARLERVMPNSVRKQGDKAVKAWKDAQAEMFGYHLREAAQEIIHNTASPVDEVAQLVEKQTNASNVIRKIAPETATIETQDNLIKIANRHKGAAHKRVEKLNEFATKYKAYTEEVAKEGAKTRTYNFKLNSKKKHAKKFERWLTGGKITVTDGPEKEIQTFINSLTPDENKEFKHLVGKASDGDIEKAIKNSIEKNKQEISNMENAINELKTTQSRVEALGGKGAKISGDKIVDAKGAEVKITPKEIKLDSNIEIQTTEKIESLKRKIESLEKQASGKQLSPEEILESAKASVTDDMLKTEQDAVNNAKKLVETEKGKLPTVQKTEQELTEMFIKEHGKKGEKVTESVKTELEDGLKKLWERGSKQKGKVAAVIGSAAVLGTLIGLSFRPKASSETV